jgi:signal-transduction protein with cAMP-binding, CBS, and nucleotidyltransferase domain
MEKYTSIKEIASKNIYFVDGFDSVKDATELMKKHNLQAVIVNKRNDADVYGIVTISDIINKVVVHNRKQEDVSIYEIMTKPTFSIPASMNVKYVPRFLVNASVQTAPIEEDGKLVGMVHLSQFI